MKRQNTKQEKLLHILDENDDKYKVVITTKDIISIIDAFGLENTPDNQICACAYSTLIFYLLQTIFLVKPLQNGFLD